MSHTLLPPPAHPKTLCPPPAILLGPGPANMHPRVSQALALNIVGHMHPYFTSVMDEIQAQLRYVLQTANEYTFLLTATGSGAMEASVANVLEPGEKLLIASIGYWGPRMQNVATRLGFNVELVTAEPGEVVTLEQMKKAVQEHKPQAVFVVHGESSVGVCQPLEGWGDVCRENGCLLIVDTVVSLGGIPVHTDAWKIDVVYSGGQKCLGCPPGVSPISFSPRALDKIRNRKTKVSSFYFDAIELGKYWVEKTPRTYHHTAGINLFYAVREALQLLIDEGLENSWKRHKENAELFYEGLAHIGLNPVVKKKENRLLPLTTIEIPQGIDMKGVCMHLLNNYNIEIAGSLGVLQGKLWRVGLMGFNSRKENVTLVVAALQNTLAHFGFKKQ